jgi:hypothetical protein
MISFLVLSAVPLVLGIYSIRQQFGNLKRLRSGHLLPSDDRLYIRNQAYRRLITGALLLGLAGLLIGSSVSGMQRRADELGHNRVAAENGEKPPLTQEEKDFFRFYTFYWISVLLLVFLVISMAIVDIWSTRRYAWQQLQRIQTENRAMLERDLAMHRQQKLNDRMRKEG